MLDAIKKLVKKYWKLYYQYKSELEQGITGRDELKEIIPVLLSLVSVRNDYGNLNDLNISTVIDKYNRIEEMISDIRAKVNTKHTHSLFCTRVYEFNKILHELEIIMQDAQWFGYATIYMQGEAMHYMKLCSEYERLQGIPEPCIIKEETAVEAE